MNKANIYIVYGVSGSGKTTIGKQLSAKLSVPFYDADDFHPQQNVDKMSKGIPLNDDDRKPWLLQLGDEIKKWHHHKGAVLACSALKLKYRQLLESIDPNCIHWIFLEGTYDLILTRLRSRKGHFFSPSLLTSQFDALEKPTKGIIINIDNNIDTIIKQILSTLKNDQQQIGLIGLGTMGKNLAKNLLSKNFSLSVYNRHVSGKEVDIAKNFVSESNNLPVKGFDDILPFIASLSKPRIIILMINAGEAVDMVIYQLVSILEKGDCIIDGGNSFFKDSIRREQMLQKHGISFMGVGISGGAEGALNGASIMPGGSKEGFELVYPFLESIAAKDLNSNPCTTYVGSNGAGHFVKMIHNGVEYAEMQLIAETYHFLRFYLNKTPEEIITIFDKWRSNGKDSYLLEITTHILRKKEGKEYLIDKILDKAGQKGTGGWTVTAALDLGLPVSNISEAVMARNLSAQKNERINASKIYGKSKKNALENSPEILENLEKAFEIASICNHHIGFEIIHQASQEYSWNVNLSEVARIWTNGCIIRSKLMEELSDLFKKNSNIHSILLFPEVIPKVKSNLNSLTKLVGAGLSYDCPLPIFSASANYILSYTSEKSSANMIQAQRDYFGSHTYQRIDKPDDQYFHTNWENK